MGLTWHKSKSGSAYLLVLLVMVSSLSMVTSIQQLLLRRTRTLQADQTEQQLRNALILALQQSMQLLSEDDDAAVDIETEAWAQPAEFRSSDGVTVHAQLHDAQRGFNLNHLSLKPAPGSPRSFLDIFEDLLQDAELEPNPAALQKLQAAIFAEDVWFDTPQTLLLLSPEAPLYLEAADLLCALPRPSVRPQPVNVNTVSPAYLHALVGNSLRGWADQLLAKREQHPIRNLSQFTLTLPPQVQGALLEMLTERSEYIDARLVATHRNTEMRLTALLHRLPGGDVEVLRCQW